MPKRVEGIGPVEPDLMAIGEAPGKVEDQVGLPFQGPSGEVFNDLLEKCGVSRREIYVTNVCKYRPPMNKLDQLHLIGVDLEKEKEDLWEFEIHKLRPKCILAIGDTALEATTGLKGILNYRGSILLAKDGRTKVVPTVHPAALFNRGDEGGGLEYTYLKLIESDIARAVEESKTRDINLPDRQLDIAHNSLDLYRYFEKYRSIDKAAVDIESINCVPVCVSFAFTRHHAISVPLIRKIGNNKLTDMGGREISEVWRIVDKELRRIKIVGQNFKYDEFKLGLIGFAGMNLYSDTLIKCRVIFPELPRKNLGVMASLWTREPFYKDDGKEFKLGKHKIDRLLKYNANDSAVDLEIDEEMEQDLVDLSDKYHVDLKNYYYNYMMRKHKFYLNMENNGFLLDLAKKKQLSESYAKMAEEAHLHLTKLIGNEVNVRSAPQVYNLLYKELRFPVMKRDPTSEDTIVALMGNHAAKDKTKKEILETLLQERRIRNQKSKSIDFHPDYDGRCRCSFNIIATETCRSSTSILDKPVRPRKIGLAFHTISKHGKLAKDIRSMFIPDPGTVFISADSSQAEARIVAVLAEDWELLKAFDTVDIHRRTAGLIFGFTKTLNLTQGHLDVVDVLEKDGAERFCGKKTRHAGNYDMKKRTFMLTFNTDAQKFEIQMSISEWRAGQMLELFHGASPKIKSKFHVDIQDCLAYTRTLVDPFGGVRIFNGRMDDSLYGEGYANIPQRTVSHLVQGGALKIEDELNGDLPPNHLWISENHDSLLMQAPANNWEPYARLMKKHLETPIDFSNCSLKRDIRLVIPSDVEMSDVNYASLKKVKL